MEKNTSQFYRSEGVFLDEMTKNMMIKYKKILGGGGVKINKTFIVCGCCVIFTFQIKICEIFFGRLHELERDEIFYNEG
jgi:hypothetical protein